MYCMYYQFMIKTNTLVNNKINSSKLQIVLLQEIKSFYVVCIAPKFSLKNFKTNFYSVNVLPERVQSSVLTTPENNKNKKNRKTNLPQLHTVDITVNTRHQYIQSVTPPFLPLVVAFFTKMIPVKKTFTKASVSGIKSSN